MPNSGELNTLVSVIQNAVQAQNLIATNISNLTSAITTAFPPPVTSSASWTPGGIANGASATKTVTVSGAALGNFVRASLAEDLQGCTMTAYVQSANTVEAVIANATGSTVTFSATTLNLQVIT